MGAHHPHTESSPGGLRLIRGGAQDEPGAGPPVPGPLRRCPLSRVLCDVSLTVALYGLGAALLLTTYRHLPAVAWPLAVAYLVFAVVQRYVFMPLVVCSS